MDLFWYTRSSVQHGLQTAARFRTDRNLTPSLKYFTIRFLAANFQIEKMTQGRANGNALALS